MNTPSLFWNVTAPLCPHRRMGEDIKNTGGYRTKTDRIIDWRCLLLQSRCSLMDCPICVFNAVEPKTIKIMRKMKL